MKTRKINVVGVKDGRSSKVADMQVVVLCDRDNTRPVVEKFFFFLLFLVGLQSHLADGVFVTAVEAPGIFQHRN